MAAEEDSPDQQANSLSLFRGLEADEMYIGGFIGPRAAYYRNGQLIYEGLKDDSAFKLIKEAGFNYICDNDFSYSGDMLEDAKKALQHAQDNDLMYLMPAYDVMKVDGEIMAGDKEIAAKLQEMYQYESFGGLYLRDEPTTDMFPFIKKCLDKLDQIQEQLGYNDLNVYINLFPRQTADWLSNGTDSTMTWPKYIRAISVAGVEYLSFDAYPVWGEYPNISSTWFELLGTMNKVAKEVGKPWMGYAQVGGNTPAYDYNTRISTEPELRWDVNTMLAFGAKGINYYILMSPPYFANAAASEVNTHSIINVYGQKTAYWYMAKSINTQVKAIDHILLNSTHEGIIIKGKSPCDYNGDDLRRTYRALIDVSGNALIGCFDYRGETALLVVNNDIQEAGQITLQFDKEYKYQYIQGAETFSQQGDCLVLQLRAGDCAMVVLEGQHISYDLNCGMLEQPPVSVELVAGEPIRDLPTPAYREGYRFAGWYATPETTGELAKVTDVFEQGCTLYAKWIALDDVVAFRVSSDAEKIVKVFANEKMYWEYKKQASLETVTESVSALGIYWDPRNGDRISFSFTAQYTANDNGDDIPFTISGAKYGYEITELPFVMTDEQENVAHDVKNGCRYDLLVGVADVDFIQICFGNERDTEEVKVILSNVSLLQSPKPEEGQKHSITPWIILTSIGVAILTAGAFFLFYRRNKK